MVDQKNPKISIIIRTLNEAKFLPECLASIKTQAINGVVEIVIVDSGSTDETIQIGQAHSCKIVKIKKSEFTFGRSLNVGCENCSGDIFVLLSAHCIPTTSNWLLELVQPIVNNTCQYAYGRQIPRNGISKYSEGMVFKKYYPPVSAVPQDGFFCNNANSAISREAWETYRFNENLTGLEDMELAQRLVKAKGDVGYVAEAAVEHIHEESWKRIKIRYERDAAALSEIEPNLHLNIFQAIKMFLVGVKSDIQNLKFFSISHFLEIIQYRGCQYWGSYVGSKASKLRIARMKSEYFYPKINYNVISLGESNEHNRTSSNESS